jgi:transcriptional regulator with XRE-family HTH domain
MSLVNHSFCYALSVAESAYRDLVCSNVARILREEREHRGISMTRLAEMAGLSQGMISLVEHEHRNPSLDTMLRMCAPLHVRLSDVLIRAERTAEKAVRKLAPKRKP